MPMTYFLFASFSASIRKFGSLCQSTDQGEGSFTDSTKDPYKQSNKSSNPGNVGQQMVMITNDLLHVVYTYICNYMYYIYIYICIYIYRYIYIYMCVHTNKNSFIYLCIY